MSSDALGRWSRMLQGAALVVIALSAVLLLAPALGLGFFDWVYFAGAAEATPLGAEADAYLRFTNGVLGAVMIGWMLLIMALARGPFRRGEAFAWNLIAASMATWFVVDTTFSLANGVFGNALLNLGTLIMFAVPLALSRSQFQGRAGSSARR